MADRPGMPADMPMNEGMDEGAGDAGAAPDTSNGYKICLAVYGDGTFSVYKEPLESPEEMQQEGEQAQAEKLDSIEQAMKMELKIYRENPVGEGDQKQFEAGFGKPKEAY